MAKIAVYDPDDTNVPFRVTAFHKSGHTPFFVENSIPHVEKPDGYNALKDTVPMEYWKATGGDPATDIAEMSQAEKDLVDGEATVSGNYGETENESGTTSTSYQTKLSLDTGNLENGKYFIQFYCEVKNTSTSSRTKVEVTVDGTVIAEPSIEAEDSDDWVPFCGFKEVNLSGPITATIKYKRSEGSGTAYIRRARIDVARRDN